MNIIKSKCRAAVLAAGLIMAVSITGCAENQIPELSDEHLDVMRNYVAATVMKYNMGRKSRLVDLSKYTDPKEFPDTVPDTPQGMDPVDDTPIVDSPSGGQSASGEDRTYRLEEVLGLPEGVVISFLGQKTYDYYPEDGDEAGFGLSASAGKKLLVLSFSLENTGEQAQEVDLNFPELKFYITVNGEYTRRAMTTILLNDLFTYSGTLEAGGSAETVLVIEVDESMEGNITAIDLGVRKESQLYQFQL